MTSFIKKEFSDSAIPLMVKKEEEEDAVLSFPHEHKGHDLEDLKQEPFDNMFKHENTSVDLFLEEIKVTHGDQDIAYPKAHISPTKPLNLKNAMASKTSLVDEDEAVMQDIPANPNATTSSRLKGPRAVFQTPKKKAILKTETPEISPSKKNVAIDVSPPKVMEYDQMTTDDEDNSLDAFDNENALENDPMESTWKQLTPKRANKPLPEPNTAESSPHKSIDYVDEPEDEGNDTSQRIDLTMEDLASIKKMTIEEKLNAVLDQQAANIEYDHDTYLEDAKFQRTKSVVKRSSYYDDMLLTSLKNKKSELTEDEKYDGLTDLYDSNIRNTKSNRSLKLDLNRSNSLQSQLSIASGERILETVNPGKAAAQAAATEEEQEPLRDEVHRDLVAELTGEVSGDRSADELLLQQEAQQQQATPQTPAKSTHSRQSSLSEALSPAKVGQFFASVGSNLRKIVSSQDISKDIEQLQQPTAQAEESPVDTSDAVTGDLESLKSSTDYFESAQQTEASASDDSDDRILNRDDGTESNDHDMIGNSTEIISDQQELKPIVLTSSVSTGNSLDEASTTLENSSSSIMEISKQEYQVNVIPELDNESHSISLNLHDSANSTSNSEEVAQVQTQPDEQINNQKELEEVTTPEIVEPVVEEPEQMQQKTLSPPPLHSFDDFSQDSVILSPPTKQHTSNASSFSSPQLEILSIWQSQPEYQHVPKQKTTRCSSIASSNSMNKRSTMSAKLGSFVNHHPAKINFVSKRIVSQDYDDDMAEDYLPNISGDSDFGSSFKKMGIAIEESAEYTTGEGSEELHKEAEVDEEDKGEIYHDSMESITQEDRNVRNIWRSGTIRSSKGIRNDNEEICVFSDEEHEVKNVMSKVLINESPLKQHKQHEASVEIITSNHFEDTTMNTSIATVNPHEISVLANLSTDMDLMMDDDEPTPLRELSDQRLNQQLPDNNSLRKQIIGANVALSEPEQASQLVNGERGRIFIRLNKLLNLELPSLAQRKDAKFCCVLDNGVHRIQTEYFKLDERILLDKEFELISQNPNLSVVLTFKAKYEKISDTLVEVKERETVQSKTFFGKLFKTKHIITRTKFVNKPAPFDPWDQIMAPDGSFGKILINFGQFEPAIKGIATSYKLPLFNDWNQKRNNQAYQIGQLDLTMLFLPRVSRHEILPSSIQQAYEDLNSLDQQKKVSYQGYLFQEGGDCKLMKRRYFKLQDSFLVAHQEDTMKTRCKINLSKVVEIIYLNGDSAPTTAGSTVFEKPSIAKERNFSDNLLTNSFKLKFANGEIIEFNAQDKFEKVEWLNCLSQVVNKNHFARQPWVKLMYQQNHK